MTLYLALGSNLGNRKQALKQAIESICQIKGLTLLKVSPIYETAPMYVTDQPAFLNQVIALEMEGAPPPLELLKTLKIIEHNAGRTKKGIRFGPRPIDLDILYYNTIVLTLPSLEIPHPRLHERGFVLVPLMDICPDFIDPRLQKTIRELYVNIEKNAGLEGISLYPQ